METETRKRQGANRDNGRRARARSDDGGRAVSEDEVEEFFAILRRIHTAARYFGDGKRNVREETEKGGRWRPAFEWEDFVGSNAVKADGDDVKETEKRSMGETKGAERKEENRALGRLDLNAEPEPEHSAHFSG